MYARTSEAFGRIDVLFNNAGISPTADGSVVDTDLDVWEHVQAVNLRSVYLCCKHGIPHLQAAGGGSVINTASFVAVMGAATSQIAYTASKGGVLALSRELGVQFAKQNIRVNALCPGPGRHAAAARAVRQATPSRPSAASCTSRWAASPTPARSPTARCFWPATTRPTSTPRRSSSTAA